MESMLKEMPRSVAIKGYNSDSIASKKNKNDKGAFADFIKDLGKSDVVKSASKSNESNALNSLKQSTKSDSNANIETQKTEILNNLLKGKNEEVKSEKTPQSPLESILQRPKATRTKLNATPEIKQPDTPDMGRFNNRDAVMRSLKGTNISFADSNDTPKFIKTAENGNESPLNGVKKAIPSVSDLQQDGQKMAQNNALGVEGTKDFNQKNPPKAQNSQHTAKDLPKDSMKNAQNTQSADLANLEATNVDLKSIESQGIESKKQENLSPKMAKDSINIANTETKNLIESSAEKSTESNNEINPKSPIDSPKNAKIDENLTKDLNANILQNTQNVAKDALDSSIESLQNDKIQSDSKQNVAQSFAKLGIANTLKYGAFKAFDALSLLKPSDGKKLSELIKKADELSLNLQSVKYTKMAQTPLSANYFANQLAESNPKIAPKDEIKGDFRADSKAQILSNQATQENKMQDNQAKEKPSDSALVQMLNETNENAKNAMQNEKLKAESKEAKASESKAPENKIAELKEQKTQESKINEPKAVESKVQESKVAESHLNETKNGDSKLTENKGIESKIADSQKNTTNPTNPQNNAQNSDLKPISFKENAIQNTKDSNNPSPNQNQNAPSNESPQNNLAHAEQSQKAELSAKMFDARETMRHFAHNLRSEIQNYKPPLTKITLELQPANLGSVEVSIISQGKNIQIQLNAPQNTLNLFIQNQSDLRTALSQIGYDNVAMSFSNGSQMGFSDNSGKWRYESNANKFRNNFGLKSLDDAQDESETFEIMITNNYA